jgi:hypothetical protein
MIYRQPNTAGKTYVHIAESLNIAESPRNLRFYFKLLWLARYRRICQYRRKKLTQFQDF